MKNVLNRTNLLAVVGAAVLLPCTVEAKVTLPHFITDNMVVQQNATLTIPGKTTPGKTVKVSASWNGKTVSTKAGDDGRFAVKLSTPTAGGPYSITIDDGDKTQLGNILAGEVWLCSGQSNMEMPVKGWGKVMNFEDEVAMAHHPEIRLLQVKKVTGYTPADDVEVNMGGWVECNSWSVPEFSAVAYFYARELSQKLRVPVGVIDCTWGGTPAEAWTGYEALHGVKGFEKALDVMKECNFDKATLDGYYDKLADKATDFDLAVMQRNWSSMPVPGLWESSVEPNLDGIVWMQYEFTIPDDCAGKPMTLHLGKIDDFDVTYLNGKLVSKGAGADNLRAYPVAASDVKAGTAVLSVRVNDTGGGGGMHGDKSNFYAEIEGRRIPLYGDWKYKSIVDYKSLGLSSAPLGTSSFPTVLYNAMLHPLHVMPIQGVIWYQGCANVGRDEQYAPLFQTMIKNWRSLWGRNFPFYFVQLAGFQAAHPLQPNSAWAALRNAQSKALALPNTGMAVAIDLGNPVDIHPKNKQEVARRLSLLALGNTYGQPVESVAPQLKSFDCKGGKVTLHFDKAVQPTMSVLTGFIIGDKDGNFAQAVATQADKYTIVVSSDVVKSPSIVRYDWADYPSGNLYGATGLPVAPFATDK